MHDRSALAATHRVASLKHELPAYEALEADPARQGEQLLLERPVERHDLAAHHSDLKTPMTLPRICTWAA